MADAAQPTPLLGRIALHLKMISMDQLAEATREQARRGGDVSLGTILVERGDITEAQLQTILRARQQVLARQRAEEAVARSDPRPEPAAAPAAARPAPTAAAAPPREAGPARPAEAAPAGRPAAAAPSAPAPRATAGPAGAAELVELLRLGVERGASDVHLHAGSPLRLRCGGRFEPVSDRAFAPADTERILLPALDLGQRALFEERGELDFAYGVPGLGRFRANVYRQQHGVDGVFRCLPARPPTLLELGLPTALARFTNHHQGLVLVTGPANCGKSSTLAALVDIVNEERREHVLAIEDPIEILHAPKRCVVNQRSVGPHTGSFARALRAALREDPDVIVIGELRDLETISLALTAAETGHLVLGTLHTSGAIRTVNRLVGVFPADQQDQIRNMVSESLRAVISQRLVARADGQGRAAALEMLVVNKAVGNLIRENKAFQIHSILQTGQSQGMCLLDESLRRLVAEKVVSREEALRHCEDPRRLGA